MIKAAFKFKPAYQLLFWFFQDLILDRIMRKAELFFSSLDFYGAIIFRSKADDCLSLVSDFFYQNVHHSLKIICPNDWRVIKFI